MLSVFNLIDTQKDDSPIIDSKGTIQGKVNYSVSLEVLDSDKTKKLNIMEYENLNELIGKYLKLIVELKRSTEIPERFTYKTQCRYNWIDDDETQFTTKIVEKKRDPEFAFKQEHLCLVTENLIQHLMYNTLTIGVYGMIESKKPPKINRRDRDANDTMSNYAPSDNEAALNNQGGTSQGNILDNSVQSANNAKAQAKIDKENAKKMKELEK